MSESVTIRSAGEITKVAERVIELLDGRTVVAFYGAMGAGKTTLIKEICRLIGVTETVTSPTFALVNRYRTSDGESVNHFDFYRIGKIEEAFDMGYEEYFYSDELCLVEWPEKIEGLLPDNVMKVTIGIDPGKKEGRDVLIE